MKTEIQSVLNNQKFKDLLKETPETLPTNLTNENLEGSIRNFTIVDLWRIEKNKRNTRAVRRWLY